MEQSLKNSIYLRIQSSIMNNDYFILYLQINIKNIECTDEKVLSFIHAVSEKPVVESKRHFYEK